MFDLKIVDETPFHEIQSKIDEFKLIIRASKVNENAIFYSNFFSQFLILKVYKLSDRNLIWRARKNDGMLFLHISQIWYPEAEITSLGRCNFENHPLFYGALEENTAIFEVELEANKKVTSLGLLPEIPITCFHIGPQRLSTKQSSSLDRNETNILIHKLVENYHNEMNNEMYIKNKEKFEVVSNFLGELFISKDQKIYPFTSCLCNMILNLDIIDAITYPSVASHHSGINIVMKPEFANKNLIFKYLNILETDYNIFLNKESRRWEMSIYKEKSVASANCDYDGTIYWFFNNYVQKKELKEDRSYIVKDKKPKIRYKTKKIQE